MTPGAREMDQEGPVKRPLRIGLGLILLNGGEALALLDKAAEDIEILGQPKEAP